MKGFFSLFSSFSTAVGVGGIFITSCVISAVNFIVFIVLMFIGQNGVKYKPVFYCVVIFTLLTELAFLLANSFATAVETVICISLNIALYSILSVPLYIVESCLIVRKNENEKTVSEHNGYGFLRSLQEKMQNDAQAKRERSENSEDELSGEKTINMLKATREKSNREITEKIKCESIKETNVNRRALNFSHVKNVIERIYEYELSATEKRMVAELEIAVFQAENGKTSKELNAKLNDGLNSLLKIMAKYGA